MAKKQPKGETKWKPETGELIKALSELSGMSLELTGRIVNDGNWPAEAGELARKYGMSQMDAEGVLEVLNRNRGG